MGAIKAAIEQGAVEIARLQAQVHASCRCRDHSPQQRQNWERACAEFHSRCSALALPSGYAGAIERLLQNDAYTVEVVLTFLELRPYFFRSGYMFSKFLRKIKQIELPQEQADRLQRIVERQAQWRATRLGRHTAATSLRQGGTGH